MSILDVFSAAQSIFVGCKKAYDAYRSVPTVRAEIAETLTRIEFYKSTINGIIRNCELIKHDFSGNLTNDKPELVCDVKLIEKICLEDLITIQETSKVLDEMASASATKTVLADYMSCLAAFRTRLMERFVQLSCVLAVLQKQEHNFREVEKTLTDPEARAFWLTRIGNHRVVVPLEVFCDVIEKYLIDTLSYPRLPWLYSVLQKTAGNVHRPELVTLTDFQAFISRFGPLNQILNKATSVCALHSDHSSATSQPWYRLETTRESFNNQIDQILRGIPASETSAEHTNADLAARQWVLRGSSQPGAHFAWSYYSASKTETRHCLIANSVSGYYLSQSSQTGSVAYYDTVVDLIYHEGIKQLKLPVDHLDKERKNWHQVLERLEKGQYNPYC